MSSRLDAKWVNQIIHGDCVDVMDQMPRESVTLTITSPPYGSMREYGGHHFDAEYVIDRLSTVTAPGGIVVWVEQDQVRKGVSSRSVFANSEWFELYGYKLITALVIEKTGMRTPVHNHYGTPEFALVLSKGKPRYTRTICDRPNLTAGDPVKHSVRKRNGSLISEVTQRRVAPFGRRGPIWRYKTGFNNSSKDKVAFQHPAIMPEALAEDLIISFSRPGDLVFDPMVGSGTVPKMAILNHRKYLGIEIHGPYLEIAKKRVRLAENDLRRRLDAQFTTV